MKFLKATDKTSRRHLDFLVVIGSKSLKMAFESFTHVVVLQQVKYTCMQCIACYVTTWLGNVYELFCHPHYHIWLLCLQEKDAITSCIANLKTLAKASPAV